jgi:hypothetical protein
MMVYRPNISSAESLRNSRHTQHIIMHTHTHTHIYTYIVHGEIPSATGTVGELRAPHLSIFYR